jgi:hypothetical protein
VLVRVSRVTLDDMVRVRVRVRVRVIDDALRVK